MFDSLDEKMKQDDAKEKTTKVRILEGVAIAAASLLLFGGLFFAIRLLE